MKDLSALADALRVVYGLGSEEAASWATKVDVSLEDVINRRVDPAEVELRARVVMQNPLAVALVRLRKEAKLSAEEVVDKASWSRSKLANIEKGAVKVSKNDLEFLLKLYGASAELMIELEELRSELKAASKIG
ncbi:MAG TPA: helix-turn-helix transcriptional regulator [Candidatus Saccharimonadales bacterium]|nr:helix-turn-helix transcriptional regulator [Candidatus Saccharimonadales bacterium]